MNNHWGAHLPGRDANGNWIAPTDLRCVGGPADGQWYAVPPEGYSAFEARGGKFWQWYLDNPGVQMWNRMTYPLSISPKMTDLGLPCR